MVSRAARFYDQLAPLYDRIHANPWMKLLRLEELRLIKKYARGRILDLGCGTGYHLKKLKLRDWIGADLSRKMLLQLGIPADSVQANAEQLPFKSKSFDTVICMYTVLNLCSWRAALVEIHRMLRPGGNLITSVASIWDAGGSRIKIIRAYGMRLKLELLDRSFLDELIGIGFKIQEFRGIFKSVRARWGELRISPAQAWSLAWEFDLPAEKGGIWLIAATKL